MEEMMDIRPTPRFVARVYAAIENDPTESWTCDRQTGRITKTREAGPGLVALLRHFERAMADASDAIERDVPKWWPEDESALGFVCPPPGQLLPALGV
jgi:hypothetical protein